uniref:butyrophilin subfamily 2 member A1-like n=1 Tax=Gasterosteus aculeatus aculeatus TaxID=481459 RepID=UPI001A97F715|nr:butyrophilin subfamily 2 member A1-like [Gasterosteus aculeatus aculeatus]
MIVTMMTVLVVLHAAVGASPAVCPIPLIEAVEGDNVTLPCHLYPEVNAEGHTFDWKRDGLEKWVYVYRDKKPVEDDQRDEYKNRTRVDPMGLKRGNMSLLIFPVKLSDSGSYRCFNAKMNSFCYANLSVVPKNQTKSRDPTNVPPTSEDPGAEKKTDVWIIVGSVLGVLGVLVVVLVMKYKVG